MGLNGNRRVTIDIDTHRVIEGLKNPHDVTIKELYRPLPDGVKYSLIVNTTATLQRVHYPNLSQYDEAVEAKPCDESPNGADPEPGDRISPSAPPPTVPINGGGRYPRKCKGITRPPQIRLEVWQMLSTEQKQAKITKCQQSLQDSQIAAPALTYQEHDLDNIDVEPMLQEILANIDFS